jgi:membrane-associated phospholipid phosphatase
MRIKDWILMVFLLSAGASYGQETDTLVKKLDSLQKVEAKNKPKNAVDKEEYTSQTNITPKGYVILLGTDFVQEVTSPFQKFATKFMADNPGLKNTSQYITNFGASYEGYVLVAFAAYGLIFKSNKVKTTTLLATQAYIVSGAMSEAVKYITGRIRPNFSSDQQNNVFLGPGIFNGNKPGSGFGSSFPSGHTTAAFSAATVFAYEYKDQILIPVIAYTAAGLVGVSRITQNAHWATDVLAGFALGYITGKQVVNNYHRYARLRTGKEKVSYHFNLEYNNGVIMPGMVCKF